MAMQLTKYQQEMLDGKHGEAKQFCMDKLTDFGEAVEAKEMVDISFVLNRCPIFSKDRKNPETKKKLEQYDLGHGPLYDPIFAMKGAHVHDETGTQCGNDPYLVQLDKVEEKGYPWNFELPGKGSFKLDEEMVTDYKAGHAKLVEHGWLNWLSCNPWANTRIPKMGEYAACSESSAAAYINTILGARTNRESPINSLYAAYTGCAANPPAKASAPAYLADFNVKIFGKATLDIIYNTARPQAPGFPVFLVPTFAGGFPQNTIDMNARQSQLGVDFTGPMIGSFQSGGKIAAQFFDPTIFADRNGFLLTQAYGELKNNDWRFAAGLQLDVWAPVLPTALPFSVNGAPVANTIRGQVRVERFVPVGSDSQLTLQAALSEPIGTLRTPDNELDEDNGWPNVEGRIAFGLGQPAPIGIGLLTQHPLEVGVSGVAGQLRRTAFPPEVRRVVSDVWGAAVDFRVNLAGGLFGFKGEAYTGQGLGNVAGGILQSLDAVTWEAIRTRGGWVEGFVYLTPNLHSHTGIAIDDPNDNDITPIPFNLFGRTYNSVIWSNLIWDVDKAFRMAFEATYRKTEYKEPTNLPNEGWGFQIQFQWAFDSGWLRGTRDPQWL